MCLIRSPTTSNANTVTVTPSCCATKPGCPLTVRARMAVRLVARLAISIHAHRDLLAAFDRVHEGDRQATAVGDRRGIGVEQADEGLDVLGLPRRFEILDDAGPVGS